MNKQWIIAVFIAGAVGVAAIVLSDRGVSSGSAVNPTAPVTGLASPDTEPLLADRIARAASETFQVPSEPSIEDRVAGLSVEILQALNATNEDGHDMVFTDLLPELIALDPAAAARLVEKSKPEAGREELLRQLAQTWTAKDSVAALTWAEQLTDTNEQRRALIYATRQIAENDPAAAVATADRHHLGDGDGAVMPDLAMVWAGTDLPGVLTWAGGQPAGKQRDEMMARIAFAESRTAPEAAARLVVEEIPPGLRQEEAAISVLHQWALQDFVSAKAWADRFPSDPLRKRALAELSGIGSN